MFEKQSRSLRPLLSGFLAAASSVYFNCSSVLAKSPLEAAQDLAGTNSTDPNGFTLMVVAICMIFVFALTLIIATSVHVFKKKPAPVRPRAAQPTLREESYSSVAK